MSAASSFRWWQGNPDMTEEEAALRDAAALRAAADELIEVRVQNARYAGMSWSKIGDALGLSKQGAAKRYGKLGQLPI